MAEKGPERALGEFLSEVQEIIETLNRNLLGLDEAQRAGREEPELLNDTFRALHSLKGLSSLFGADEILRLTHRLEDLLDSLRLGKLPLSQAVLDLLFESVDLFQRATATAGGDSSSRDGSLASVIDEYLARLSRVASPGARPVEDPLADFAIDPAILSVLTEYEEHRLRENVRVGRALYRVHIGFDLLTIDKGLADLKARLKAIGEVITYLPSSTGGDEQTVELDVIVGSSAEAPAIEAALAGMPATLSRIGRTVPPTGPEAVPSPEVKAPPLPGKEPRGERVVPALLEPERAATLRSVTQSVRVDIRKLDSLMNVVGEIALARAAIADAVESLRPFREHGIVTQALHRECRALERKLSELQTGILEVRMVQLGQVFEKLSRVVRKLARESGKDIRLEIEGAETELDKLIVEELSDPLMHMIRNCIDHGIEVPTERVRLGKSEVGVIRLSAAQKGNHVVVEVSDDGAGIDEQRLIAAAIERGALDRATASELNRREVLNLVFLAGVSTKESATEVSGRGVGMDVVKTNIARLSGIIDVDSTVGEGTRYTITLPITLAIIGALIVRVAERTYAVPLSSVLESLVLEPHAIRTIERREAVDVRGTTLPLLRLETLFRLERTSEAPPRQYVVVVGLAHHRMGLVVDDLVGQQDIVIKSLGRSLSRVRGISGATELGGQQTVLVLDIGALIEEVLGADATGPIPPTDIPPAAGLSATP